VVKVAQQVQPTVVSIQALTGIKEEQGLSEQQGEVLGSGVILGSKGYILTNAHVVKGADKLIVVVNKEKYFGKLVGADEKNDIAVLQIPVANLPTPKLGLKRQLKVGELAVAVGSPFGFQQTVTAGVISALKRSVRVTADSSVAKTYSNLIQTDADINPGNSGGALANRYGEIIGINSLIYSSNGLSQGIGFAIPIKKALEIARQIIKNGVALHPFLGIKGQTVDPLVAEKNSLAVNQGALVVTVLPQSPAAKAGLKPGDVIVTVNGQPISSLDDLLAEVQNLKVGQKTNLTVVRAGQRFALEVFLGNK
jgi:serine protease DegQ